MIPAALLAREASERGTSPGVLRRIVVEGFAVLPGTDVLPVRSRTFLMQPQEGPQEFVDRLIATYPAIDSADHAQEFRAALCACRVVRVADVGRERVEQALRLLASGTTVPAQANRSMAIRTQVLIGGSREAHFRHCRSILDESESTVAMKQDFKAAGLHSVALNTVIEFGLAAPTDAHLVRGNVAPIDLEPTSAIETLRRRFRELKPQGAGGTSIGRIAQYASVRRIIGLDALDDHPEALVHDVVDWLIAKGIAPGVKDVHGALQGPVEQIRAILRRRHFERQDVQLPPRKGSFVEFSLADFRTLLPGPLQQAAGTILDPENGTALNAPRGVDLAAVSQNVHPILREVAAIVALHGPTDPSLASIQKEANIALRYLSGVMSGADPRRAGDVIVCLQAVRHVANGTTGQERRRLLRAIRAWPWIVRIFESFRSLPSISEKTAVHLDGIAPVMPASLAPLLAEVRQELEDLSVAGYETKVGRIGDLLDNLAPFYDAVCLRRRRTRDFRDRVRQIADAAATWEGLAPGSTVYASFVEEDDRGEPGRRKVVTRFAIHPWCDIDRRLRDAAGWKVANISTEGGLKHDWERGLFENRFAVEFVSCTHEDGSPAPAPHWFELHDRRLFWPRSALTETQIEEQSALLTRLGATKNSMDKRAAALGNFRGPLATVARHARERLGMLLLPVEEHNHWEAYAMYTVSARLDEPVRPGEHLQYNVGEGLGTSVDEAGNAHSLFKVYKKKKLRRQEVGVSTPTEAFAEELLELTRERKFGGGPPNPSRRPAGAIRRGPDQELFLVGYGDRSLSAADVDGAVIALTGTLHRVRGQEFKIFWNRLAMEKGLSIEERRDRQGHERTETTEIYNPLSAQDSERMRMMARKRAVERRQRLLTPRDRTEAGVAAPGGQFRTAAQDLRERIAAATKEGRKSDIEELRAQYARLQMAISRAQAGLGGSNQP